MTAEESYERLGNVDSFFECLDEKDFSKKQADEMLSMALTQIDKMFSLLDNKTEKQKFAKEISSIISKNEKALTELNTFSNNKIEVLQNLEDNLKENVLKGYYTKSKTDLTHTEQMLLISYLQDLKKFPNVSEYSHNKGFFTIISALLNRNEKNTEQYLYNIKDHRKKITSLENILQIFKKAKFKEAQELVEKDIIKAKES